MIPYWLLFLYPALAQLAPLRLGARERLAAWWMFGLITVLAVGLRYQVGGDWDAYLDHLDAAAGKSLGEILLESDPGYHILNWIFSQTPFGIYGVNTVCGLIVTAGVLSFAGRQPLPWLVVVCAVPYLIVVVAMGYTRQSAALGLELLALGVLAQGRVLRFVTLVILAATFHKSAVLLLPIAALAGSARRLWVLFWVFVVTALSAQLLLIEATEALWEQYVQAQMQSEGAPVRVAMNAVPAALFLIFHRRLALTAGEHRLWVWISLFALACVPLVSLASTAVDRVALYLLPLQLYVFPRLVTLVRDRAIRSLFVIAIVGYYALVLWVWLNYAVHAFAWVPYRFALWM